MSRTALLIGVLGFLLVHALSDAVRAQRLGTYDPTVGLELAMANCAPAPAGAVVRNLPHPIAGPSIWQDGAMAADNVHRRLYYCNGIATEHIQRLAFSGIGGAGPAFDFLQPPGFNHTTGMADDPSVATGALWVTDGQLLVHYLVPAAAGTAGVITAGPFAYPNVASGILLTGLARNPFDGMIYAVDENSDLWIFDPMAMIWMAAPLVSPIVLPAQATGVEFCHVAPGTTWISYAGGQVLEFMTGAAFPAFPVRSHRGSAFLGIPAYLGGGGGAGAPVISFGSVPYAGSPLCTVTVNATGVGLVYLGASLPGFAGLPLGASGTLMLDPASLVLLGPAASPLTISFNLPAGAIDSVVLQGAQATVLGGAVLSEAFQVTVWVP